MFLRGVKSAAWAVCAVVAAAGTVAAHPSSVAFQWKRVLGVPVNVVTVNLNDPEVRVAAAISRGGIGTAEHFVSLINRAHPAAAITGSFFDTRSLRPVGDIVVDGETLAKGGIGTGVAFTATNEVDFVPLRHARGVDWAPYSTVICAGPWLV
ncbi:MAG: hypothetical protein QHJ73_07200, partial [Armatimonadota bacterium]|nr:hypothetical protein [Armatimonadota bacterium]